ncbi:MAG: putative holin-like toxin [Paenibacillus sp.]
MEVKDAMTLMLLFGTFILALLTTSITTEKVKTHPKVESQRWVFVLT